MVFSVNTNGVVKVLLWNIFNVGIFIKGLFRR